MNSSKSKRASWVTLGEFMGVAKALADENRVRMLLALRGGELCLCQISALMGLAASTASKHMSILRMARLVRARKQGRWVYYRWPGRDSSPAVRRMLKCIETWLANDRQVLDDARRLGEILKMDPEAMCGAGGGAKRGSRASLSSARSSHR